MIDCETSSSEKESVSEHGKHRFCGLLVRQKVIKEIFRSYRRNKNGEERIFFLFVFRDLELQGSDDAGRGQGWREEYRISVDPVAVPDRLDHIDSVVVDTIGGAINMQSGRASLHLFPGLEH